ncbi:MAG: hypothetical protein E6Q97_18940 [Desulfurellales bacterium]|nr:MAG: hypothetical protein E6Q97_18940 [Desulfurellales bacterium]
MLWHCLENIKRAHGSDAYHYIFRLDRGHDPAIHEVLAGFPFSHQISEAGPIKYREISKQSHNLLQGYAMAAQLSDSMVILVEEDIMVATDFFGYHEAVHEAEPNLFCSIGVANPNRRMSDTGPRDAYYLSDGDYCSLGVAFKKEVLQSLIAPHATADYFVNPEAYCRRHFPGSPIGHAFVEQDGLIRRIQMRQSRPIAYPWQAKAYHAGVASRFRSVHRRGSSRTSPRGTPWPAMDRRSAATASSGCGG